MRTTVLMSLSALCMGIAGLAASFAPQELITHLGAAPDSSTVLLVQAMGALYLGFAILNWMARNILIGGIYARPVALGNFLHFGIVSLAGWKAVAAGAITARFALLPCGIYTFFAIWFGLVLFTHPRRD